jgi:hypothetical protein
MMAKAKKPTKSQLRCVELVRAAGGMILTRDEDGEHYSLVNGSAVNIRTARNAIDLGLLRPQQDGLFPGETQTYIAA